MGVTHHDIMDVKVLRVNAVEVTSTPAELNTLDGAPLAATIAVGAEAAHPTHSITATIQLKDGTGADVPGALLAYLSDDANGNSLITTAPDGGVAIGTDGLAIPLIAGKTFILQSESDGDIDLVLINTGGAKTCYLILILPTGVLVKSGAITFSA